MPGQESAALSLGELILVKVNRFNAPCEFLRDLLSVEFINPGEVFFDLLRILLVCAHSRTHLAGFAVRMFHQLAPEASHGVLADSRSGRSWLKAVSSSHKKPRC